MEATTTRRKTRNDYKWLFWGMERGWEKQGKLLFFFFPLQFKFVLLCR